MAVNEKKEQGKDMKGQKIINNNVLWALGIGIIPLPLIDIVGTSAVQIRMIHQLSEVYGVEFSKHRVKSIIGALAGGLGAAFFAQTTISLLKPIPLLNTLSVIGGMPLMMGATTYGMGKVFALHFASGGTLLDFDPQKLRDYFAEQVEEGKKVVDSFRKKATA